MSSSYKYNTLRRNALLPFCCFYFFINLLPVLLYLNLILVVGWYLYYNFFIGGVVYMFIFFLHSRSSSNRINVELHVISRNIVIQYINNRFQLFHFCICICILHYFLFLKYSLYWSVNYISLNNIRRRWIISISLSSNKKIAIFPII